MKKIIGSLLFCFIGFGNIYGIKDDQSAPKLQPHLNEFKTSLITLKTKLSNLNKKLGDLNIKIVGKIPQDRFDTLTKWADICFTMYKESGSAGTFDPVEHKINKLTKKSNLPTFWAEEYQNKNFNGILNSEEFRQELNKFKNTSNSILEKTFPEITTSETIKTPYIQKKIVDSGSKICFIGDIHGSLHSLLRNLLRLKALGYINDDLSIAQGEKFYMVFLGDYVDRGRYSIEVLYTLLKLKNKNWDNVFLLRGNHEDIKINNTESDGGFIGKKELEIKTQNTITTQEINKLYNSFPLAFYIGSGKPTNWIQCCHGGIEPCFNPNDFLANPSKNEYLNISAELKAYKPYNGTVISQEIMNEIKNVYLKKHTSDIESANGFNWCDFDAGMKVVTTQIFGEGPRAYNIECPNNDTTGLRKILGDFNIKSIFRGHQHNEFGFKIGGKNHWKSIPSLSDRANEENGFKINSVDCPIFTFSAATEGAGVNYDCFGLLTTADQYEDWRLLPYEFELDPKRTGNYVIITGYNQNSKPLEDPITFKFIGQAGPTGRALLKPNSAFQINATSTPIDK